MPSTNTTRRQSREMLPQPFVVWRTLVKDSTLELNPPDRLFAVGEGTEPLKVRWGNTVDEENFPLVCDNKTRR